MRVVALEEHFTCAALPARDPGRHPEAAGQLADLGEGRIAIMDEAGIDFQVLSPSSPATQEMSPAESVEASRTTNDVLAEAISRHPDRFGGFAILPTPDPKAAAVELERAVTELGFCGAMLYGHSHGRFLDADEFSPIFEAAESLDVPLYLHPTPPTKAMFDLYFTGLPERAAKVLSTSGWGWHAETGMHVLRLIVSGLFDRYPGLRMVIGHMGENVPFSLARADSTLTPASPHLQKRVGEYFTDHFWITTSAYFTIPPFQCALAVMGIDRILFSVDYPFSDIHEGRRYLDQLPISPDDREKLAHTNAERLLGLSVPATAASTAQVAGQPAAVR